MDKITIHLDASALKESSCPLRLQRIILHGLQKEGQVYYKLAYGTAFHKFLQNWYCNKPLEECLEIATDYYLPFLQQLQEEDFHTLSHLRASLQHYAKIYPRESDGIVPMGVEEKFSWPCREGSWYRIVLSGTVDLPATFHGIKCIIDHKTSGTYQIESYFKEYSLSIQGMFYVLMDKVITGRDYYLPLVINGLFLKKPTIAATKLGQWDGVKLQRSNIIEYSPAQMEFFKDWLEKKINEIVLLLESFGNEDWPYELSACQQKFGLCKFFDLCATDKEFRAMKIKNSFVKSHYNPLQFQD